MKSSVKDEVWLIERTNERGYRERIQFIGSLKLKPRGWRVVRHLGPSMAGDGSGIV